MTLFRVFLFLILGVYMSTAKRSLADLAAAFTSKTTDGGGGNANWKLFFNFWKAPVDSVSTVRFLPDANEDNPMGFLVENLVHELTINGKREKVPCLKMYGEACPICELSARYYDEKSPEYSEELGKKFYRKKSYLGQVLVVDTPVEHNAEQLVKLIDFGPQVFKQIQAAFQSVLGRFYFRTVIQGTAVNLIGRKQCQLVFEQIFRYSHINIFKMVQFEYLR